MSTPSDFKITIEKTTTCEQSTQTEEPVKDDIESEDVKKHNWFMQKSMRLIKLRSKQKRLEESHEEIALKIELLEEEISDYLEI
jgi:hypothetical protein